MSVPIVCSVCHTDLSVSVSVAYVSGIQESSIGAMSCDAQR